MSVTSITSASAPRRRIGTWAPLLPSSLPGVVEVVGALALIPPGLAWFADLWLGGTMFFAVLTHVFVLYTSPVPAIVLGVLNALIVYPRRDQLASFAKILAKVL